MPTESDSRRCSSTLLFVILFAAILAAHAPLLRLPYFWDEAGYYVPAARDLLLTGSLIPHSTPSNAHPPLVMAVLALAWKLFGYSPLVTRTTMLAIAAFSLTGLFGLAERVANRQVATAATVCTAIYPVFFMQSMLAQVDLAAAGLTFWGLRSYVKKRWWAAAAWLSAAALAKETAILAPLALFAAVVALRWIARKKMVSTEALVGQDSTGSDTQRRAGLQLVLLLPVIPLALWYLYHFSKTGFVFGNPEFFRYNVQSTMRPLRIALAIGLRCWQLLGYLNLYVLTLAAMVALWLRPVSDEANERRRIEVNVQLQFGFVIATYVIAMAVVGGAVLARYMLPVLPLVIIICVSTLRRRMRGWWWAVAAVAATFASALFINPAYGFSIEDNLACRDYIEMHLAAEHVLENGYPNQRVLTAWPASDEITHPYLGYVSRPFKVLRIEDFTGEQLMGAGELQGFEVALVFSTKYEPPKSIFGRSEVWTRWKSEFFGYHRDLPPAAVAKLLRGNIVYEEQRPGQWIAIIKMAPSRDLPVNAM